jgi:hypothetical protein
MTKKEQKKIIDRACELRFVIEEGNTEGLEEFVKDYPDIAVLEGLMHTAAEYSNIEALKVCLKSGLSPDCCDKNSISYKFPPLWEAVHYGSVKTVEFLLDAGANNTFISKPGESATYLAIAAGEGNLPMVKMLLKRGADLHAEYSLDGGITRYNALKRAVFDGNDVNHEVTKYLRSQGAVWIEDEKNSVLNPTDEQMKNLSQYFRSKPLPLGLTEIVPASVPLMVHIFPPKRKKRDTTVFITSELIEYALIVPETKEEYQFAEYFIEMPGKWATIEEALAKKENIWSITWLKAISRYPHENETYYGEKKVVTPKMIPSLKTPDGRYNSAKVERVPELDMVMSKDGRFVIYYQITPIE